MLCVSTLRVELDVMRPGVGWLGLKRRVRAPQRIGECSVL